MNPNIPVIKNEPVNINVNNNNLQQNIKESTTVTNN